jgi:2-polyprenyl-6-methoxyphenol hydroxylase-like FAD-dependent oxidoreductase
MRTQPSQFTDHLSGKHLLQPLGGGLGVGLEHDASLLFVPDAALRALLEHLAKGIERVRDRVSHVSSLGSDGACESSGGSVVVHTEGGEDQREFDLVVGADGLDSTVRSSLEAAVKAAGSGGASSRATDRGRSGDYIPHVVRRGYVVIRGTSTIDALDRGAAFQAWGPKQRFAAVPFGRNKAAWFATIACSAKDVEDVMAELVVGPNNGGANLGDAGATDTLDALSVQFGGWDARVGVLLRGTDPLSVVAEDARALSSSAESLLVGSDKCTLVGDALHCVDPVLAQGAGVAFEDAHALAVNLIGCTTEASAGHAMRSYLAQRSRRATNLRRIAAVSQWFGQVRLPRLAHAQL